MNERRPRRAPVDGGPTEAGPSGDGPGDLLLHAIGLACVGRITADVAHRVNTSLATIVLAAERVERADLAAADLRRLEAITSSAEQAAAMVRQLVALVHEPDGPSRPVDLGGLVRETVDLAQAVFPRAVGVTGQAAADLVAVQGVPGRLRQLLWLSLLAVRETLPPRGWGLAVAARNLRSDEGLVSSVEADGLAGCRVLVEVASAASEPAAAAPQSGPGPTSALWLQAAGRVATGCGGSLTADRSAGGPLALRLILPAAPARAGTQPEDASHAG